ncbi:hypothetical protein ULMS_08070 [Patiriisocius marinistellae]|uniref:DUF1697 domain-containing protein n=1 Tax=Patiriisocius marinistellae TaxID=2494560 RepID=A0A5J4FYQ1_9FLAO|nr:DUF1697 domain-containing protein [Patiriisocius marinistellae]GEQ85299.1 hypothetical protein ULMS_08070 [Patiriisocius marinistellae]
MIYIALLRGINVGGHKKFPKVKQLEMLDTLKFENPKVYLHTGNWIFTSEISVVEVSAKIENAIHKKYGWQVPVIVFKASEILQIFNACPFSEEIKVKSYFTLLDRKPTLENRTNLNEYNYPDEEFYITNNCIYFYPVHGAGRAKMSNNFFENKLKVTATSRNYKTMNKIIKLSTPL